MKFKTFILITFFLLSASALLYAEDKFTLEEGAFLRGALSLPNTEWQNYVKQNRSQINKDILKKMENEMALALADPKGGEYAWNLAALADIIATQLRVPADYRLGLAAYHYQQKNYPLVLDICANIFLDRPKDSKTHLLQGMTLEAMGDSIGAFSEYKNAIKFDPQNARAHYQLGLLYLKSNQPEQGNPELALAKKLDPNLDISAAALPFKNPTPAQSSLPAAEANAAASPPAQSSSSLGSSGQVKVTIEGGVSSNPGNTLENLAAINDVEKALNLGDDYFHNNDWDNAILAYKRAIELNPNYSKAYAFLGSAYMRKNQPDEAIEALKKAIELDPNAIQAQRLLGNALELKYDQTGAVEWIDEAIAAYMKALDLAPDDEVTKQYLLMALKKKK
jgi:tetratricopeptide (TPR) repeat protein